MMIYGLNAFKEIDEEIQGLNIFCNKIIKRMKKTQPIPPSNKPYHAFFKKRLQT